MFVEGMEIEKEAGKEIALETGRRQSGRRWIRRRRGRSYSPGYGTTSTMCQKNNFAENFKYHYLGSLKNFRLQYVYLALKCEKLMK